jgi:hypothetical protein
MSALSAGGRFLADNFNQLVGDLLRSTCVNQDRCLQKLSDPLLAVRFHEHRLLNRTALFEVYPAENDLSTIKRKRG